LTECTNHALVHYRYEVGGQTYSGWTNRGNDCNSMKKGDDVLIYYSKRNPDMSEASDPREALVGELTIIGLAAFFSPPAIILLAYLNRNRVRRLFAAQ
jgi:hypothetical protein